MLDKQHSMLYNIIREGTQHPLQHTDDTAKLESTQRVNAKIDLTL